MTISSSFRLLAYAPIVACLALFAATGCNSEADQPPIRTVTVASGGQPVARAEAAGAGAPAAMPGMPAPAAATGRASLPFAIPAGWTEVPPASSFRVAEFRIAGAEGTPAAEVAVFNFGPGQGGDADSNIQRWLGTIIQPDGAPSAPVATRNRFTAGAWTISYVEVAGTLLPQNMPGAPARPQQEGSRLAGAILESGDTRWFVRITGPDATVAAAVPGFMESMRALSGERTPNENAAAHAEEATAPVQATPAY